VPYADGAVVLFVDAERQEELLGRERDRWNNQDYRRFGGYDYRSPVASPPNVYSLDGQNLPGLDTPFAAAELNTDTGTFDFLEGRENLTSLRAYQGIVPRGSRATVVAKANTKMGSIDVSTELLAIRRENEMQLFPSSVSGYTMGAHHPENPYGVPVKVDALLAGLPAQRFQVQTDSQRVVVALDSQRGRWAYRAFLIQANELAKTRRRNVTNAAAIEQALYAVDWREVLSLYSTMRRVAIPERILMDMPINRYVATATQLHLGLGGPVFQLPAGELTSDAGMEYRQERMGLARREVTSSFAKFRTPLIHSAMKVPGIEELSVMVGVRRDDYGDIGAVTRRQFGLDWRMTESIRWQASSSESFRPPSLAELYWPRVVLPSLISDTRRSQTGPVELITGGNPQLRPTWGHSNSIGVSFQATQALELSAEYWQVEARGHIAALAPLTLLANEEVARHGYVVRAPPSAEDVEAGRPGRLLALDISRQNVGGASTQGVDVSIRATINTVVGEFSPAVSASLTHKFLYSDLPIEHAQMEDRVGVASEFGTIPAQRAVASLMFDRDQWRASIHARVISSYRDRSSMTGAPMQRRIAGGVIWDVNVTRNIGGYVRLTLGAFNVTDREPPFAHVGGSLGFDASQGDLSGREIYGQLTATF
jgi:iron complex outermembrane receptor protein